jgi:hypothetical protein
MLFDTLELGLGLPISALSELTPCSTNTLSFATEATTGVAFARHAQLPRFNVSGLDDGMWFVALLSCRLSPSATFACALFSGESTFPMSSLLGCLPVSSTLLAFVFLSGSPAMIKNGREPHAAAMDDSSICPR